MIIDRYIFRLWLEAFCIALLATLGALLLHDLSDNLPDLLELDAGIADILRYYLILLPGFIPAILPISLMISILLSLGSLHQRSEIIAMRASGMGLWRITRSLWVVGTILTSLLFFLNGEWAPWSVETARRILEEHDFKKQLDEKSENVGVIHKLTFNNPKGNRIWFMNRFSELTLEAHGVSIYQKNADNRVVAHYTANEAYFDDYAKHWILKQGRATRFDSQGEQIFSLPFEDVQEEGKELKKKLSGLEVHSEDYQKERRILSEFNRIWEAMKELDESPNLMRILKKRPKDLSLLELRTVINVFSSTNDKKLNPYKVRYHTLLATPASCLIVVALAIPFAIAGVRAGAMIGVAKALGLFVLYFFIANLSILLGEAGVLRPTMAAWLPNISMAAAAVWLFKRAR